MECRQGGSTSSRPLSPHLSIYRPQFTSVGSISHRITGAGLYVCLLLAAVWVISAGFYGNGGLVGAFFSLWIGKVALFAASFAMFYHACNGVRHLLWDAGHGFNLACARKGALITVCAAGGLTVLTWAAWLFCN